MKKVMVLVMGVIMALSALPLHAADVTFSGEFRVRGFWTDNLTDGNSGGGATEDMSRFNDQRFRLKTTIKAGVTTGVVVLDIGNCFGGVRMATFGAFGGGTGDCRFGGNGLGGSVNAIGMREAYLRVDLSRVALILGRQTIKLGHGIVFDDTADAVTVVLPMGSTILSGSMLKVIDPADAFGFTFLGEDINSDTTVWLVNLGMERGRHLINFYDALLYSQDPLFVTRNFIYPTGTVASSGVAICFFPPLSCMPDKLWLNVAGASWDGWIGPLALAFEGSYAIGQASNVPGSLFPLVIKDARLRGWNVMGNATVDAGGGVRVGGTVLYASGQDPTSAAPGDVNVTDISGNFQFGNILLNNEQRSDREGGSLGGGFAGLGILAVKLHADLTPIDKLTVGGAVIYARMAELCSPANIMFIPLQCQDRTIGYELDANAKYAVDDNLSFSAGAGYLITAGGARDFYSGITFCPGCANSNLWKLSARAVFTF